MKKPEQDEFFVGYLPVPSKLKAFLISLTVGLGILSAGLAVIIATQQTTAKDGTGWDPEGIGAVKVRAVAFKEPYDLARFEHPETGKISTAVLTSMIKTSISERLEGKYNQPLQLEGVIIQQDGRYVFSVLDGEEAVSSSDFDTSNFQMGATEPAGEKTLRGEIIDPKCYIGAMKPGGGKTHKSCAVLCIRGGIAPMFVQRDKQNQEVYFLVTDTEGKPLVDEILGFVGDPIEAQGIVEKRDDLYVLKLNPTNIKRL